MSIKQGEQYWLVTISESDFMLNFERVEVVRYKPGDRFAVVTQLCPDGTIWSKQLLTVNCSNLFTDLKLVSGICAVLWLRFCTTLMISLTTG